jgi:hypothetical protein
MVVVVVVVEVVGVVVVLVLVLVVVVVIVIFIIFCVVAAVVIIKIADDLTVIHILQSHLIGCSDTAKSMVHGFDLHKHREFLHIFY